MEHPEYSISSLCRLGKVNKAAYYKWLKRPSNSNDELNHRLAELIKKLHQQYPDMGYRRLRDMLDHEYHIRVNDKRILRICRKLKIQSVVKNPHNCCTRPAVDPAYIAENILNREFDADRPEQKWVTDVSEFKYGPDGDHIHKLYLSVILDLYGRIPVATVISDHNDNKLVYDTFDQAIAKHPGAAPLFHSDRGYQYTSKGFHDRLEKAGMTQSMSRVAHCIDNGVMEGFWGILKREAYYGRRFKTKDELVNAIAKYINYYTYDRPQRNLGVKTPEESVENFEKAA